MLQTQYFQQAEESHRTGNLKLALIYLKKLKKWDRKSIALLVDSSYELWQQLSNASVDDVEAAQVVQDSFAMLLNGDNISNDLIVPWDYIRLSHVYIVQGNLQGAAEIVNIASSKGHMENILIVTHTCFIMNGLNRDKEVQRIITFLSSTLLDLAAKTKTNEDSYAWQNGLIPYYYLYIMCATFLQKRDQFRHERDKKQTMKDFESLLRYAYFFATSIQERSVGTLLKWYQDDLLWFKCAESLESGPFLLLSEAFYWEAFIRAPLMDEAIAKILESMRHFGRADDIPNFLARALIVNEWNTLCRKTMRQCEEQRVLDPTEREWSNMFDSEDVESIKVQSHVRGWILRRRWPSMLPILLETRRNHFAKMHLADTKYEEYTVQYHTTLVKRWKKYIEDWKNLKWTSAVRMQSFWRMKFRVWIYREMIERVKQANSKYFVLCQRLFVTNRMAYIQKWQQHFMIRKKYQSAQIIADFLFLNGYNRKLVKGMNEVLKVLRVSNKHIKKRIWRYWFNRYQNRQKKHARVTIRFFLRDACSRIEERKVEEQLKIVEEVLAAKKEVTFEQNHLPLLRSSFAAWILKYQDRLKQKAVLRMVYTLQHRYYRKKAKEILQWRILRREAQRAYCAQRRFRLLTSIIQPWQVNAAALRLQRFVRYALALKKYRRLRNINNSIRLILNKKLTNARKSMLWRWRKYVFLVKREKLRAIRYVLISFRRAVLKSKLKRINHRKPKLYHFLETCHLSMLSAIFRFIRDRAKIESRLKGAQQVLTATNRMALVRTMRRWHRQLYEQAQVQTMRRLFVHQPIDRFFWPGAHVSVEVKSHKGSSQRNQPERLAVNPSLHWEFHPWEKYVPSTLHLLNITQLNQAKAFRAWMAQYRRLQQFRYDGAYYQARLFQNELFDHLRLRMQANLCIQTWFRALKGQRVCRRLRQLVRWAKELDIRRQRKRLYQCWRNVQIVIQRRQAAWPIVVKVLRINVAKQIKFRLRKRYQEHLSFIARIDNSKFQKALMRRFVQRWLLVYCHRVLLPSYNLNKHFQPKRQKLSYGKKKGQQSIQHQSRNKGDHGAFFTSHDDDFDDHRSFASSHNKGDNDEEDDGDDDDASNFEGGGSGSDEDQDLNPRLRKLLRYQKRLKQRQQQPASDAQSNVGSFRSQSMVSLTSQGSSSMGSLSIAQQKRQAAVSAATGKKSADMLPSALSRYVSSGIMFFRSEHFHRILQQVRLTQLFIYDTSIASLLQEQEIYFLLQQAAVVVLKDWNIIAPDYARHYQQSVASKASILPWKYICNAFRGQRIIIEGGSAYLPDETDMYYTSTYSAEERQAIVLRREQFREYMKDLIQGKRDLYEKELIDRAKWPLTIPTSALATNSSTSALSFQQQRTATLTMHWNNVRISHRLAVYVARLFQLPENTSDAVEVRSNLNIRGNNVPRSSSLESLSGSSIALLPIPGNFAPDDNPNTAFSSTILAKVPSFSLAANKSALQMTSMLGDRRSSNLSQMTMNTTAGVSVNEALPVFGVAEWSVDATSVGTVGILLTMMAVKTCPFLRRLKLTIPSYVADDQEHNDLESPTSGNSPTTSQSAMKLSTSSFFSSSESFLVALRILSENKTLEELHIQGRMTCTALQILQDAIRQEFVALSRLQIAVATEDLPYAQSMVDIAKMRSYSSLKQGVSIYIDEL